MRSRLVLALALWLPAAAFADCVILLHGLARTSGAMEVLEEALTERDYVVANVDYPSREKPVEMLAPEAIDEGLARCAARGAKPVHFITHSMGGILVRYYLKHHTLDNLGRVVMMAPPNQGSEVVDTLADVPGFELLNGPAGLQLGTGEDSLPAQLGPVDFPLGVIAGNKTFNPMLSQMLPNPDDGKVSVANTQVEGMTDFLVVEVSHPFIMQDEAAIEQAIHFLEHGAFAAPQLPESHQVSD